MDERDARLLERVQHDFPLDPRPFAVLGEELGMAEAEVRQRLARLKNEGLIRQIRPLFNARSLGYVSTLVAARVDESHLDEVVDAINACPGVTHNYLREHEYNVWFTLIARSEEGRAEQLAVFKNLPGVEELHSLPAGKTYKLRVNFKVAT